MHFIIAGYFSKSEVERGIKKALKKFGCTSAILSGIEMHKHNCITKEKYEKMYKTNEESEIRMDLSVQEDLETFIERIKNGKINKGAIHDFGEHKETFLLCLLDKEQRKKLEEKDEYIMRTFYGNLSGRADVPEVEWKASECNMKYARSECLRKTYFIDASIISLDWDLNSFSD